MKPIERPPAFFIADHLALDLLNSIAALDGTTIEWIENGSDLIDWVQQTNLIDTQMAGSFYATSSITDRDAIAMEVRELREWFREFVINHAGKSLTLTALETLQPLNKILSNKHFFKQIGSQNFTHVKSPKKSPILTWQFHQCSQGINDLLPIIAEIMGDLICNADFKLIKNCEGPTCPLWLYDISKNHSRRWCSMSICGNRAKAAAHRAKKRDATRTDP